MQEFLDRIHLGSVRAAGTAIAVTFAYFLAAILGLSIAFEHGSVSPAWPPAGVALAALLALGVRLWPGVFVGAFLANTFLTGSPWPTAFGIATGNTLEAIAGCLLIQRLTLGPIFSHPRNVVFFSIAAMVACAISATVGTLSLCASGAALWPQFAGLWFTWWTGDVSGVLVVTPFVLTLGNVDLKGSDDYRPIEKASLYLLLAVSAAIVFGVNPAPQNYPFAYLLLPFSLWAALRFGSKGVAASTLILTGIAIAGTVNGYGPFIGQSQNDSLLALQLFIAITSVAIHILASTVVQLSTSRQGSEETLALLNTLLETAPIGLGFIDREFRYVRINEWLASINGIPAAKHIGKRLQDLLPKLAERTVPIYQRVLDTGQPIINEEISGETSAYPGQRRHWLACYYPVRINHNVIGVGVVVVDFTERKKAEDALKTLAHDLAQSNRELEQFAYVASHDLQEPLRMVSNYMGLVSNRYRDKFDSDGLEYIDYAIDGAKRMRELIQGLLDYCRVGQSPKDFSVVSTQPVFETVLADLRFAINESNAEISFSNLPPVCGDSTQLRQLFQNLLSNAMKFRTAHRLKIEVGCVKEKDRWLFSITDNGIGFEMAHAEKVFALFQRLNRRKDYPGTGMGLALCRKIVERHGGNIWAESEVGKGSTFYFTIPTLEKYVPLTDASGFSMARLDSSTH